LLRSKYGDCFFLNPFFSKKTFDSLFFSRILVNFHHKKNVALVLFIKLNFFFDQITKLNMRLNFFAWLPISKFALKLHARLNVFYICENLKKIILFWIQIN
jgi:hypothetical protein